MLKHKSYSVTDKIAVIASIKCSESIANMSCNNGVLQSTVHGWLRQEEKLGDFVDMVNSTYQLKRKKVRTSKDPQLQK